MLLSTSGSRFIAGADPLDCEHIRHFAQFRVAGDECSAFPPSVMFSGDVDPTYDDSETALLGSLEAIRDMNGG